MSLFSGSTLISAILEKNRFLTVVNVGDSRAVACDSLGRAIALSADHKPSDVSSLFPFNCNVFFFTFYFIFEMKSFRSQTSCLVQSHMFSLRFFSSFLCDVQSDFSNITIDLHSNLAFTVFFTSICCNIVNKSFTHLVNETCLGKKKHLSILL